MLSKSFKYLDSQNSSQLFKSSPYLIMCGVNSSILFLCIKLWHAQVSSKDCFVYSLVTVPSTPATNKYIVTTKYILFSIKFVQTLQKSMFRGPVFFTFYQKFLVIAILTTHHDHTFIDIGPINVVMGHTVRCHL